MKVYLSLNNEAMKRTKPIATQRANNVNEDDGEGLLYDNAEFFIDSSEYDPERNILQICGDIKSDGEDIGWLDIHVPIDNEFVLEIIEAYKSKLNKVKAVLEATK